MTRLAILGLALLLGVLPPTRPARTLLHEARYWHALKDNRVACDLCPRRCVIASGQRGFCRVRENRAGKLYSIVYDRPCSVGKEPIEKAPFFHFLPGQERITLATVGCNQACKYCQNWEISQARPEDVPAHDLTPAQVVALARQEHCPIICLTYTEPVVFFEYVCDIARLARAAGIRTAVVTGAYINPEPLAELCSLVDAIKIDLKGFTPEFYQNTCGSTLEPVLQACKTVARSGVPAPQGRTPESGFRTPTATQEHRGTHLELVNLVVPARNDDTATIRRMCLWVKENLGDTIPIHFTRFTPNYRLRNTPATPTTTLESAIALARAAGLQYVYIGNVPGHKDESTYCPACTTLLIHRSGFSVIKNNVRAGKCPHCGRRIPGIWT